MRTSGLPRCASSAFCMCTGFTATTLSRASITRAWQPIVPAPWNSSARGASRWWKPCITIVCRNPTWCARLKRRSLSTIAREHHVSRPRSTLCLNMIVKNERAVIERCLASVKSLISHWVIVDTGSSDGTQEVIRSFLREIPGQLVERPWVNFAHNRSEALDFAVGKADYLLFIDADEVLEFDADFVWPELAADAYSIETRLHGISY